VTSTSLWTAPADLDPECVALCEAINVAARGRVATVSSCCGHGEKPYRIWIDPITLDDLPPLLYWFDACHSGIDGWQVRVYTDCGGGGPFFVIEGPVGAFADADKIAGLIVKAAAEEGPET
jgi:hypothetical protein